VRTIVTEALGGEMTVDQFCVRAMTECLGAKKVTPKTEVFKAYSKRDQNSYSLIRAMQKMLLKKPRTAWNST